MLIDRELALVPTLRREDISWRTAGSQVEIQIRLVNESDEPTEEAELVIEAAPFGAFIPFEPLTRLTVAGFEPRETRMVSALVDRARLDAWQSPIMTQVLVARRLEHERRPRMELPLEWVGNLNVYFDRAPEQAAERHWAYDIKVRAAAKIALSFIVGDDGGHAIETVVSDPDWFAEVERRKLYHCVLVSTPSEPGRRANIDVLVTRESDSRVVRVEFAMETVEAPSDMLGCVQV